MKIVERGPNVQPARPEISDHIDWILLAVVPSIMLLATTNQVCLDVATIPFLWVLPLTLYLLSFIIAFAGKRWYPRKLWMIVLPPFLLLTIAAMLVGADEVRLGVQFVVYFGALFATSMFCHGELVRLKPHPMYLTNFYLCMSAGGAMGGLFVGLVVPYIFDLYLELHVAIIAAQFLLIWIARCEEHRLWRNLLVGWSFLFLIYSPILLICEVQDELKESRLTKRSFYGVVRVHESEEIRQLQLYNGHIQHGSQFRSHALRRVPTLYYARSSAAGQAIESLPSDQPRHFGLVGLGCGTMAAYATELDRVTCYEINNQVLRIAGHGGSVVGDDGTELVDSEAMTSPFNEYYFTYVEDCPGDVFLVPGDARTSLDRQPTQNFDILVLDAFSSDAIPIHLLTKEAFEIYLRHMKPNGIIAVHVSNLHFDLPPVLLGIADEFGLSSRYKDDQSHNSATWPSQWVLLSASEQPFKNPLLSELGPIGGTKRVLWTDDFSSLADLLMEREWGEGEGGLLTLLRELDVARLFTEGNTPESKTGN